MKFSYTLSSEGSTDQMLVPVINWVIEANSSCPYEGTWASPSVYENRGKDVETRIAEASRMFPCDILFVHRDVDASSFEARRREIIGAAELVRPPCLVVPIVPERMSEAWFLFDEDAIRNAADNPRGRRKLPLVSHSVAQRRANPKAILEDALVTAADVSGRRLEQFRQTLSGRKELVARSIENYAPLRNQASFRVFEADVRAAISNRCRDAA